jgi:hypothetical protein
MVLVCPCHFPRYILKQGASRHESWYEYHQRQPYVYFYFCTPLFSGIVSNTKWGVVQTSAVGATYQAEVAHLRITQSVCLEEERRKNMHLFQM